MGAFYFLVLPLIGFAFQTSPSGTSTAEAPEAEKKIFGFQISMTGSGSLHSLADSDRVASLVWTVAPTLRVSDVHRLTLGMGVVHDFRAFEDATALTNGRLGLWRTPYTLAQGVTLMPRISARLPFNDRSLRSDSLVTSLQADARLGIDLSDRTGLPLSVLGTLSFARNLHTFSTSTSGASNSAWEMSEGLTLDLALGAKVSVFGSATFSHTWSYEGSPRSQFEFGEGVQVEVSQGVWVVVGHTNSGNTLRANGQDSNIALFDPNASSVYGSMSFSY